MSARTLRLSPKDVMTGDILVERDYRGGTVEDVVTMVEPVDKQCWRIVTVRSSGATYAVQRRVTVKRSGPKGLGE